MTPQTRGPAWAEETTLTPWWPAFWVRALPAAGCPPAGQEVPCSCLSRPSFWGPSPQCPGQGFSNSSYSATASWQPHPQVGRGITSPSPGKCGRSLLSPVFSLKLKQRLCSMSTICACLDIKIVFAIPCLTFPPLPQYKIQ